MSTPTPPRRPASCTGSVEKKSLCIILDSTALEKLEGILKRSYRNTWYIAGSLALLWLGLFVMAWL